MSMSYLYGVNDRPEHAQALAGCLAARGARQPDPVQPGGRLALRRPDPEAVHRFVAILRDGASA